MTTENGSSISLPSFRDGIVFDVNSLNFGGTKAMIRARVGDDIEVVDVMLFQTLKREFPNVTQDEIDLLGQEDYLKLIECITKENKGLGDLNEDENGESTNKDFTDPANTIA
ncbi:MAG: hypothetical protein BA871_15030 [Desulfuromonadales bacterium C00003096]|jgi:hypothetical protein|nr:MAG: hypothetical protein BA871_15030 [Desulfuromonadales bacterium C00003096]